MNDEQLAQLMRDNPTPAPSADAKARAMQAAMAEFAAAQAEPKEATLDAQEAPDNHFSKMFQGFLQSLRLTRNTNPSKDNSMPKNISFSQKQFLFSGLATCCLVVIAVLAFNNSSLRHRLPAEIPQAAINEVKQKDGSIETDAQVGGAVSEPEMSGAAADAGMLLQSLDESLAKPDLYSKKLNVKEEQSLKVAASPQPMPAIAVAQSSVANRVAADAIAPQPEPEFRDRFKEFSENSVTAVKEVPVSTFSIDVDTSSYSFVRRMLNVGHLPSKDAVRTEEMINYFDYAYPVPTNKNTPFTPSVTVLDSPWTKGNKLIHIGIKGYQIPAAEIPRSNLVFLLDVSGSMNSPDKLPLVQQSMGLLLDNLKPDDTIAIVIYAGAAGTVLEPTPAKEKQKILAAINKLQAGGSTAGAEGIALAYQLAEANFNPKSVNRIILATDGDFNVGETGDSNLQTFVERKRNKGIYLSVLGFGQGNYQDALMQTLAQNGNGTAAYIDTLSEAQKVLVHEATSTLFPIASDVKIQVEFNPDVVAEYRLIGYETRALKREDFNNDKVDAGEVGSGHSVTAIYEITPVNSENKLLDHSRYRHEPKSKKALANEYGFLRLRYKLPGAAQSQLMETPITVHQETSNLAQREAKFATAVAGFSQILRGSNFSGDFNYDKIIELAQANKGDDEYGYRTEFIQLVRKAKIAKGQ